MNVYLVYTLICENRAKIDGIKISLVGDVPVAHLVLREILFIYFYEHNRLIEWRLQKKKEIKSRTCLRGAGSDGRAVEGNQQ